MDEFKQKRKVIAFHFGKEGKKLKYLNRLSMSRLDEVIKEYKIDVEKITKEMEGTKLSKDDMDEMKNIKDELRMYFKSKGRKISIPNNITLEDLREVYEKMKVQKNEEEKKKMMEEQQMMGEEDARSSELRKSSITHKNPWIQHVKRYAKEHNVSYMCAISDAKKTYKKTEPKKVAKKTDENLYDRGRRIIEETIDMKVAKELLNDPKRLKEAWKWYIKELKLAGNKDDYERYSKLNNYKNLIKMVASVGNNLEYIPRYMLK
jgi:hypothetical protein